MCTSGSTNPIQASASPDFCQAFKVLDIDRDGKISQDDLMTFYSDITKTDITNAEDIVLMISVADKNKNGVVELEEFEQVLGCNDMHKSSKVMMEEMLKVMDRDGDGKVGFEDLKWYMSWAGFPVSDEDVKTMIELGSGGKKDGVGIEGLMKILALDSF